MSKFIVSLVSDQTIPNILFIQEMRQKVGDVFKYIFITTEGMEQKGKTDAIVKASHIEDKEIYKITVKSESLGNIEDKLNDLTRSYIHKGDEILLNLTGGTKIMAIGAYDFFRNYSPTIYYLPVGKNVYATILPYNSAGEEKIEFNITVDDYLAGYGININNRDRDLLMNEEFTKHFFSWFTFTENKDILNLIREKIDKPFRNKLKKKKKVSLKDLPEDTRKKLVNFLDEMKFPLKEEGYISKREIEYLIGGWFEEYVYARIKREKKLRSEYIKMGVNITRKDVQNEFDVIFIDKNTLYVIECKTGLRKSNNEFILNDALYKLSALREDFGLIAKAYLLTLEPDIMDSSGQIREREKKRARVLRVSLLGLDALMDETKPLIP